MEYSLSKIARELGLSKTTVSFILSGKAKEKRISEEVEHKVKEFCESVNYVPNIHAQRINSKYIKSVGVLIDRKLNIDNENPFSDPNISGIIGGIAMEAENIGYRVQIQLYSSDMDENKVFDWLRNHEIDGLIYYGLNLSESWKKTFADEDRKVVGIGVTGGHDIPCVNINNFEISKALGEYLIERGNKSFLYIRGMKDCYVAREREGGFFAALRKHGIDAAAVDGYFSEYSAYEKISSLNPDVDAVVCANDNMAIGAVRALNQLGKKVPEQISVAGGDNISIGQYFSPGITTFDNMPEEMGRNAFNMLYDMIKGGKAEDRIIKSKLIIRDSAK